MSNVKLAKEKYSCKVMKTQTKGSSLDISNLCNQSSPMSRPLRLEFPGAIYHVTTRGNAQGAIFLDDEDRVLFFSVLAEWSCPLLADIFFMESRESRPVKADCSLSRFYFSHSVFSQNCLVISIPGRNACELGCTMTRSR
ncbi:hypothetical protein SAMN06297164_0671 [Nitrosomonas ureae]|uniref:Uncharacterized protein n=1 Tax=Nitrosomonas ureae TaxID=44577 RepID=A0A286A3Z8_9PROT|nr:hypothetical protein SAMN06297164_0671 [Nitrosomonas ureae]